MRNQQPSQELPQMEVSVCVMVVSPKSSGRHGAMTCRQKPGRLGIPNGTQRAGAMEVCFYPKENTQSFDFKGFLSKTLAIMDALEASTDAFEAFDAIGGTPRTSHDQGLCHPSGSLASTPGGSTSGINVSTQGRSQLSVVNLEIAVG